MDYQLPATPLYVHVFCGSAGDTVQLWAKAHSSYGRYSLYCLSYGVATKRVLHSQHHNTTTCVRNAGSQTLAERRHTILGQSIVRESAECSYFERCIIQSNMHDISRLGQSSNMMLLVDYEGGNYSSELWYNN